MSKHSGQRNERTPFHFYWLCVLFDSQSAEVVKLCVASDLLLVLALE
jgi:hypothetical protein